MSFHPQTPQSPSQFSPATSDPLSIVNTSSTSITTALPTPAHSVNGASSQPADMAHELGLGDESPNKRKRPLEDLGDREQKKVHLDESRVGIEDLHLDVGEKYLLCRTPHPPSLPSAADDLYEMYNLAGLASEVAREKPSGEKNALRKTYKGHIKKLGVLGHFDSVKKDINDPDGLMAMLAVPDLEWDVHQVKGHEMDEGRVGNFLGSLGKPLTMSRGPIPKNLWDSSALGDLAPNSEAKPGSGKPAAPGTPAASTPSAVGRSKPQAPGAGQDPARPKRNVKKRSYGDSSYEGYGEGFPDDDGGADTGYSSGGGDDRGNGQKRRKKNSGAAQPQFPSTVRQSYGPGMVGA